MSEVNSASKPSVDLRSQLAIARRYWWFTALVLIAALAATFVLTQRQERIYSSSAQVVLRSTGTATTFPFSSTGPRELNRTPETEVAFAQSPTFRAAAREASPSGVSVSVRANGDRLTFTGRGTEPADVAAAATTWAELYVSEQYQAFLKRTRDDIQFLEETIAELNAERDAIRVAIVEVEELIDETEDADQFARLLSQKVSIEALLQPQLGPIDQQIATFNRDLSALERITIFLDEPFASARVDRVASVPSNPVSPNVERNLIVGLLLGLAVGIGVPFLWHSLSDKIGDANEVVEITNQPIIGVVPPFEHDDANTIEVLERPTSFASAQYQAVLTAIEFAAIAEPINSILFTSAVPGEGKTTTAVNIAALASKHKSVLLIDADMRRPKVHEYIGEENTVGLSDVLAGEAEVFDVRRTYTRGGTTFDVLTAGRIVEDPAVLLRGEAWTDLVQDHFMYDLIVVDGPPVLAVTDALLAGFALDGQVLLSRHDVSKREDLAEAIALLETNGARSLGVVVNHQKPRGSRYVDYSNYSSVS